MAGSQNLHLVSGMIIAANKLLKQTPSEFCTVLHLKHAYIFHAKHCLRGDVKLRGYI